MEDEYVFYYIQDQPGYAYDLIFSSYQVPILFRCIQYSNLPLLINQESTHNQLEKKSITELGRAALEGRSVGTVTEADLFETKEYGETAQRVIRDSGLEQFDPAKNERVEVKNGDYAAFIDDMAAAASRQAGHAAREKQNYLEKKKNS